MFSATESLFHSVALLVFLSQPLFGRCMLLINKWVCFFLIIVILPQKSFILTYVFVLFHSQTVKHMQCLGVCNFEKYLEMSFFKYIPISLLTDAEEKSEIRPYFRHLIKKHCEKMFTSK